MRIRFSIKAMLVVIALVSVGLGAWHSIIRYYAHRLECETRVLAQFKADLGNYTLLPKPARYVGENLVSRREHVPAWVDALHVPIPRESFTQTTGIAVHWVECLGEPIDAVQTVGKPPSYLNDHFVYQFSGSAGRWSRGMDWPRQTEALDRVREFYRSASELEELETFKPGALFGNEELERFRKHRSLRVLDLSGELHQHSGYFESYFSRVDEAGLEIIAEGLPGLRYLVLEDHSDHSDLPLRRYSRAAVDKLQAKRPELKIVHYRLFPFRLMMGAPYYYGGEPAEIAAIVDELNALPVNFNLRRPGELIQLGFEPRKRPPDEDLRMLSEMPYLRALDFSQTLVADEQLSALASVDRLEFLALLETSITAAGLANAAAACPELRGLWLDEHSARADGVVDALRKMPKLERLTIYGDDIKTRGEELAAKFAPLAIELREYFPKTYERGISLGNGSEAHVDWAQTWCPLVSFPTGLFIATEATIDLAVAREAAIRDVARHSPTLQKLHFKNRGATKLDLNLFTDLPELQHLIFEKTTDLTDDQMRKFTAATRFPRLEKVEISSFGLNEESVRALKDLRKPVRAER